MKKETLHAKRWEVWKSTVTFVHTGRIWGPHAGQQWCAAWKRKKKEWRPWASALLPWSLHLWLSRWAFLEFWLSRILCLPLPIFISLSLWKPRQRANALSQSICQQWGEGQGSFLQSFSSGERTACLGAAWRQGDFRTNFEAWPVSQTSLRVCLLFSSSTKQCWIPPVLHLSACVLDLPGQGLGNCAIPISMPRGLAGGKLPAGSNALSRSQGSVCSRSPLSSLRLCLALCGAAMCPPALDLPRSEASSQRRRQRLPLSGCLSRSSPVRTPSASPASCLPLAPSSSCSPSSVSNSVIIKERNQATDLPKIKWSKKCFHLTLGVQISVCMCVCPFSVCTNMSMLNMHTFVGGDSRNLGLTYIHCYI